MSMSVRIQELREKNNLSQEQLADKLGVSRQAVSKWETEQTNPDIENIIKLTTIFNVSSDYLLTGVSSSTPVINSDKSNLETSSIATIIVVVGAVLLILIAGIFFSYKKYFL